jgi:hypothetical protein
LVTGIELGFVHVLFARLRIAIENQAALKLKALHVEKYAAAPGLIAPQQVLSAYLIDEIVQYDGVKQLPAGK